MILFLAITGWLTAAFLAVALYSCRRNKSGWHRLYHETFSKLIELERKHLVADIDSKSLQWYRDEVTRLSNKCAAICRQVRKMKGRGRVTCQMDPMHNF